MNQHNQLEITSQYIAKDKKTYSVVRPTLERMVETETVETATFPQIIHSMSVPHVSEQQFRLGAKLDLWFAPAQHNDVLGNLGEVLAQPNTRPKTSG